MIASLRGTLLTKEADKVVVEAGGVGYEVLLTKGTAAGLPAAGDPLFLHVCESIGMYGGGTTLYGFLTPADKAMFLTFKECVPSTGAKKALEHLEKASKSLPDFRRAILDKDTRLLIGVFGFTKKTAERLIDSLKEELESVPVPGPQRIRRSGEIQGSTGAMGQALNALSALGYHASEARAALLAVAGDNPGVALDPEQILRMALKKI